MKKLIFCLIVCLASLPAALNADTVVEEIIARVNNQIITRSEYQREREQLKQEAQQQDAANADKIVADRDKDVLRGLIDQQLMLEKGKDLGISADTDLIKRLDEIRKQMNLESMDDLEKAAQAQGVSFEDFKQNMKTEIITQQVIQREVGSHMNVGSDEIKKFYEDHKSELARPEAVKISEILISTDPAGDDQQKLDALKAKAEDLVKQIRDATMMQRFVETKVVNDVKVSDQDVKAYYEKNPDKLTRPERIHISSPCSSMTASVRWTPGVSTPAAQIVKSVCFASGHSGESSWWMTPM